MNTATAAPTIEELDAITALTAARMNEILQSRFYVEFNKRISKCLIQDGVFYFLPTEQPPINEVISNPMTGLGCLILSHGAQTGRIATTVREFSTHVDFFDNVSIVDNARSRVIQRLRPTVMEQIPADVDTRKLSATLPLKYTVQTGQVVRTADHQNYQITTVTAEGIVNTCKLRKYIEEA